MCGRLFIRILVWLEQQYYRRYDVFRQENDVFRQENDVFRQENDVFRQENDVFCQENEFTSSSVDNQ